MPTPTPHIVDITPEDNPVALANSMVKGAPGSVAGIYILVDENGDIEFNMCGYQRMAILWGLARLQHQLLALSENEWGGD